MMILFFIVIYANKILLESLKRHTLLYELLI
jgi:hypothetical protein